MAIYMQYEGIKGDVTAEGHKEWIDLGSFQWGVGRGIGSPTGRAAERESSPPSLSEVTVTKQMDNSSPYLFIEAIEGGAKTVKIDFCKTSKGKLETYLTYTLTHTLVSGYSVSSGGDKPSESLSLNFTKFEMKYTPQKGDANAGSPIPAGYDLGLAKKI